MQEIFYFFLGGFVYYLLNFFTRRIKELNFILQVRHMYANLLSFYLKILFSGIFTKYYYLVTEGYVDEESLKRVKIRDFQEYLETRKDILEKFNESVPSAYKKYFATEEWNKIYSLMDRELEKCIWEIDIEELKERKAEFDKQNN